MNHLKTGNAFYGQGTYKNYKYNGKELQETGFYAMDWRNYMPDLGRFTGMDALSEAYYGQTPYHFALNNPVNYSDPTGMYTRNAYGNITTTNRNEIDSFMDYLRSGGSVAGVEDLIHNNASFSFELPEISVTGKGTARTWTDKLSNGADTFAMYSKFTGAMGELNLQRNRANYYELVARTGADKVERNFYLMFGGALVAPFAATYAVIGWAALGSYGALGAYAQGAIIRGGADLIGQQTIKGSIDPK